MASEQQVRTYLAYWFQLGKKLLWRNGQEQLLPQPVINGDRYSQQFEDCWRKIMTVSGKDCYLEGSRETIEDLLSPAWDIDGCARCAMPVPVTEIGIQSLECVCNDLENWPNSELPQPRSPVSNSARLNSINSRLKAK